MSRKFRKHYSGYARVILAEFMTEAELNALDLKYSEAKWKRLKKKVMGEVQMATSQWRKIVKD